jgi:hypothetical protein
VTPAPQEFALDQQDVKVRTVISSISTSDDETTTTKSQTDSKRLKKQKIIKETGLIREYRRSLGRQRKTANVKTTTLPRNPSLTPERNRQSHPINKHKCSTYIRS